MRAAEELARAGYSVVAFLTANGRDVQCHPHDQAPSGNGPTFTWKGNTWSVQARNDNYWVNGPSLVSAITRAGWTLLRHSAPTQGVAPYPICQESH